MPRPSLNIFTVKMTLVCGALHLDVALTFTAKRPCCSRIEVEMWAFWTSMNHFVFGGVTTAPATSGRNEEDIQTTEIKEIEAVSVRSDLFMPKNFKIAGILNRAIHSQSGGG